MRDLPQGPNRATKAVAAVNSWQNSCPRPTLSPDILLYEPSIPRLATAPGLTAQRKDQNAFGQLTAKYADMVFATALRQTGNRDLAEDVTQAVFIVLARRAPQFRPTGSLGIWLHKTARYAASSALRAESRRRPTSGAAAEARAVSQSPSPDHDHTLAVERALHRLRSRDRQIIALHYLDGLTMPETATVLHLPLETARKRLSRALERLRSRLSGQFTTASIGAALARVCSDSSHGSAQTIASTAIAGGGDGQRLQTRGKHPAEHPPAGPEESRRARGIACPERRRGCHGGFDDETGSAAAKYATRRPISPGSKDHR